MKEAREKAALLRNDSNGIYLVDVRGLITALDHRITELEAQRDELEKIVVELGGVGALPTTVYASDKEDKG